jgi:hypothetical protein
MKHKALTQPKTPKTATTHTYTNSNNDNEDLQSQKHPDSIDPENEKTFGHEVKYYMHKIHNKKDEIVDPALIRLEYCKQLRQLVRI